MPTDSMRLAVIGDVHLYQLWTSPLNLLGKRLVGQLNLWLNRRFIFDPTLFAPLVQRVLTTDPQMLLLSGDLTTTALPEEFAQAAQQLQPLLTQMRAVAVPGNHDRYTPESVRSRRMERALPGVMPERFPLFEPLFGPWQLLALNAGVPTLAHSRGSLGSQQMAEADRKLSGLSEDQAVVILCHYPFALPPARDAHWKHALNEADQLRDAIARCRARVIYIHGHVHIPWCWQPQDPELSHVTDLNAGAPCLRELIHPHGQGFWTLDLPADPRGDARMLHHCFKPAMRDDEQDRDGWVVTDAARRQP